jgi:hypothetical protein
LLLSPVAVHATAGHLWRFWGHQVAKTPKSGQAAAATFAVSVRIPTALAEVLVNNLQVLRFLPDRALARIIRQS